MFWQQQHGVGPRQVADIERESAKMNRPILIKKVKILIAIAAN